MVDARLVSRPTPFKYVATDPTGLTSTSTEPPVVGKPFNKYVSKKLGNGSGYPSKSYVKPHNKAPKLYVKPQIKSPKLNGPKFKSSNLNGPKLRGQQAGPKFKSSNVHGPKLSGQSGPKLKMGGKRCSRRNCM